MLPQRDLFEMFASVPLIAADGAANKLTQLGVGPEFIVGDLDSVSTDTLDLLGDSTTVIADTDQNSTDFEKSIRFAESQLYKRLLIVGIHGGDLEHTLNNWSILMRHGKGLSITVLEDERYAIPVYDSFSFSPRKNEMLSLIPQPLAELTTSGLEWELNQEILELGSREGARNRAASDAVEITIHAGSVLFVCDERIPVAPELE